MLNSILIREFVGKGNNAGKCVSYQYKSKNFNTHLVEGGSEDTQNRKGNKKPEWIVIACLYFIRYQAHSHIPSIEGIIVGDRVYYAF